MARGVVLGIGCFVLSACFPMSSTYEHIDAPGSAYFKSICRGTIGPPSTVYYPFNGIYVSLNFSSTTFGLHIPDGMVVQLNGDVIKVTGATSSGEVQKAVHIKAVKPGASGNNDPIEFGFPGAYTSADNLGPFTGASSGTRFIYYLFMGVDEDRPDRTVSLPYLLDGVVELPSLTINGHHYESQSLHFKQMKYSEIAPINC